LNPLYVFVLPLWLLKGKATLKQQIADQVGLDVTLLPHNETLLAWLRHQHAEGRRLILATPSNTKHAEQVGFHL